MRIKTATATGVTLNWLVAKAKNTLFPLGSVVLDQKQLLVSDEFVVYTPSTNWNQAGPIIADWRVCTDIGHDGVWLAWVKQNYEDKPEFMQSGPTLLIAAMRTFVTSRLGREVDVPEELKN